MKSAYWVDNEDRFSSPNVEIWRNIWKSNLHERQKVFLWRIASGCFPIRKKLSKFIHLDNSLCPLCEQEDEDELHLFQRCYFMRMAWLGNNWGFRIGTLKVESVVELLNLLLSPPKDLILPSLNEKKFSFCSCCDGGHLED